MVGMHSLLTLMHTPEDIFQDAYTYIMIICGGIFAQVLYNILASILRALGNSKTPLYFLILAALLNIVLDLTFIIVFHMGVAGAAWAKITAQGVSGVLCLIYIIKYVPELRLKADDWRFRSEIAKKENNHTCNNGIGNSYNMRTVKSLSDSVQFTRSYILCIICCHCCSDCNICLGKNILNLISCRKCRYCIGTKNIQCRLYHHGSDRSDGILQSHGNAHKNFFFGNL